MQFERDSHNLKHIIEDHPERTNTAEEVESVFDDPNLVIKTGIKLDGGRRFNAVGKGNSQIMKVVVFTINEGLIRPIGCWPANKQIIRCHYETLKANKVPVIKKSHTAAEMREIEKDFIKAEPVKLTIEELIKAESARQAKANSNT